MGLSPLLYLARYQAGLKSGILARHVRSICKKAADQAENIRIRLDFPLPQGINFQSLSSETDEIISGYVRLFGGQLLPLNLKPGHNLVDWVNYETGDAKWDDEDPKMTWEPARFGWALKLARQYHLDKDEQLARFFWHSFEEFINGNPPLKGPNWSSGQEVAIRLISLCLAAQVFSKSIESTPSRLEAISQVIAIHAARISPTLDYARAQGNNHLISEAAGLYTAGLFLSNHPMALSWRRTGWQVFHQAIQDQIAPDGTYTQHSINYHRLMLELSLWMKSLADWSGDVFPNISLSLLSAAVRWLVSMADPSTGLAPNLGSNDGAHFLPLSVCSFFDFRPTIQAASCAFLETAVLPSGPWDELGIWLGFPQIQNEVPLIPASSVHVINGEQSRGYLRAVNFTSRPNQADQLHVDLWYKGYPITLDAGTYRYTSPLPWNNSLAGTLCHNTASVDEMDQMYRAGKFLWLRWAQAKLLETPDQSTLVAETDAYRQQGISHRRALSLENDLQWLVQDAFHPLNPKDIERTFIVHWLLPDKPWQKNQGVLEFSFDNFLARLSLSASPFTPVNIQVIRCGQILAGGGNFPPYLGWYSPTYNTKIPALSIRYMIQSSAPVFIQSEWKIVPL